MDCGVHLFTWRRPLAKTYNQSAMKLAGWTLIAVGIFAALLVGVGKGCVIAAIGAIVLRDPFKKKS